MKRKEAVMPNGTKAPDHDLLKIKVISALIVLLMIAGAVNALHQTGMRL